MAKVQLTQNIRNIHGTYKTQIKLHDCFSKKTGGASKSGRDTQFSDEDRRTYWAIMSLRECLSKKQRAAGINT